MRNEICGPAQLVMAAALGLALTGFIAPARAEMISCDGKLLPTATARVGGQGDSQPDLLVRSTCLVTGSPHIYNNVNIVQGGKLIFVEPDVEPRDKTTQDFWAKAIIIENGGEMLAGVPYTETDPVTKVATPVDVAKYGTNGKTLQIHIYGAKPPQGSMGALCVEPEDLYPWKDYTDCGIPREGMWNTNGGSEVVLPGATPAVQPTDYFYKYGSLHGDASTPNGEKIGHFGNKTLALSWGGTLRLRGLKGTTGTSDDVIQTKLLADPDKLTDADMPAVVSSGTSWARLAGGDGTTLTLDRSVTADWKAGDQIVVTTTDYSPAHSEVRTLAADPAGATVTLTEPLEFKHNATAYKMGTDKIGADTTFSKAIVAADGNANFLESAETRAAVGLLTRSIRILSAGDGLPTDGDYASDQAFNEAGETYSYGAQAVFREGFKQLQIQGVEFAQMGQGGVLGRYPVHFHETRRVPKDTYVVDSSINESMTRWVVIHSTLGVTLARNVGFKSIGHGYYLEDSTETDNKLYANLGVFARAAVEDLPQTDGQPGPNPRRIPGILSATQPNIYASVALKYHSDALYPSVFWITNGWNSIAGNMAAGAGTCGACYWIPSTANHDFMDVPNNGSSNMSMSTDSNASMVLPPPMTWKGYSAIQKGNRYGRSPVRMFYRNSCSSAMHALNNSDGSTCNMAIPNPSIGTIAKVIPNDLAPPRPDPANPQGDGAETDASKMYYPRYSGQRRATICDPNVDVNAPGGCLAVDCENSHPEHCAVTAISHFTTSFNWAEGNFSSVWLRSGWLMYDHGFLSDVQGGGITEISGGDYTRSSTPQGYWALTSNSIFVGETPHADNPAADLAHPSNCTLRPAPFNLYCVDAKSSTAIVNATAAFLIAQRLYNIYDGPAYEDANAYLDITATPCDTDATKCMAANDTGVRKAAQKFGKIEKGKGYLPNAAIGWKQPNGFYYPPAFHSRNLFFNNVDIRHYVIEPLTDPGTYVSKPTAINNDYLFTPTNIFNNWTDVDRQTELNDDDGSLTGLTSKTTTFPTAVNSTLSLNEDPYFRAPVQTAQCKSNVAVDPAQACAPQPTGDNRLSVPPARTSPYDQITTVIYPGCAVANTEKEAQDACDQEKKTEAPWVQDCTHENCYGLPIYRDFLTSSADPANLGEYQLWTAATHDGKSCAELGQALKAMPPGPPYKDAWEKFNKTCRFPFMRMAGVNGWQRSVLTSNNGTYYIDTTVSKDTQLNSADLTQPAPNRVINVFGKGKTYYVFFLFAKNDGKSNVTKQTYQIYVGPNFQETTVKGVKIVPNGLPLSASSIQPWEGFPWTPRRVGADGILTVEVDFSKVPTTEIDPHTTSAGAPVLKETCKPVSFCKRNGDNTCGCDESKVGIMTTLIPGFKKVCETTCNHWAVSDLDCPGDGCRGFSFTLPDGFDAQDQFRRPAPEEFPTAKAGSPWSLIQFEKTTTLPDQTAGQACNYDKGVPGQGQCKVVQ